MTGEMDKIVPGKMFAAIQYMYVVMKIKKLKFLNVEQLIMFNFY